MAPRHYFDLRMEDTVSQSPPHPTHHLPPISPSSPYTPTYHQSLPLLPTHPPTTNLFLLSLHTHLPLPTHPPTLHTPLQYISIPDLKHFPSSSSFSFHLWVCLDSLHKAKTRRPLSAAEFDLDQSSQETKMKRILYRYMSN